jgi:hypothetical protein
MFYIHRGLTTREFWLRDKFRQDTTVRPDAWLVCILKLVIIGNQDFVFVSLNCFFFRFNTSLVIALSVLLRWLLHCLSFFVGYCIVCPSSLVIALSVLLRFTASDYPFGIFKRFLNRKKKQFKETNTKSWLPIITNFKIQTSQASGLTVVSCLNLSLSQNSLFLRPAEWPAFSLQVAVSTYCSRENAN